MFKYRKKIDEKIASKVVKYLVKTNITPNQVTTFSLLLAAFAAVFFNPVVTAPDSKPCFNSSGSTTCSICAFFF